MLDESESYHDLRTLVEQKARKNEDRIALRTDRGQLSYRDLYLQSCRAAQGFRSLGVNAGDKVAFLLYNSLEFVFTWYGLNQISGILVPLNTALKGEILRYELLDSDARILVVDPRLYGSYEALNPRPNLDRIIILDPRGAYSDLPPGTLAFPDFLGDARPVAEGRAPRGSDPASILYTSGTTGPPKGVVIPHEKYLSTARAIGLRSRLDPSSVLFTALPLFHCNAQEMTTHTALLNDLTAAYDEWFHASSYWETAARLGATHVSLLISMINVLYKQPERPGDRAHTVRVALTAGTGRDIWERFEERFGVTIIELYGMTECGCTTLMNPPDRIRVGSVGLPLDFVEAQVVDDDDNPVPAGTKGELVVRPRRPFTMMLEYYKKPDKTVEAWRNLWFHTGDYVYQDEDGYFYFVDRKKDVIRRRGENIAPYDVEQVLNQHPAVLESVVVGVPSPLGEEDVKAYVVLRPGQSVRPEEIFRFAAEKLPFFMVPQYLEFLEEVPKTANQKAQRYLLRQRPVGKAFDRDKLGVVIERPHR